MHLRIRNISYTSLINMYIYNALTYIFTRNEIYMEPRAVLYNIHTQNYLKWMEYIILFYSLFIINIVLNIRYFPIIILLFYWYNYYGKINNNIYFYNNATL